jgi:ABC-type nitrate/sulfonate/bicarbonate transport system ATPase subunit
MTPTGVPKLKLEAVAKTYRVAGQTLPILEDIHLEIAEGELVCLLGRSGCGKTTLLQIASGLEPPTSGGVFLDGQPVTKPDARIGLVFQKFSLFPWLTVTENVAFGLKLHGVPGWPQRVTQALALVGLTGFENARPAQLSTGMAQRVALARTLVTEPHMVLMDEPFSALDPFTRMTLADELVRIWQTTRLTTLFVTHDIDEAIYLGDRVVLLSPRPGHVQCVLDIPLRRPRHRGLPSFFAIRSRLYQALGLPLPDMLAQPTG